MNTRNNRASAIGLGMAALVVLPAPDGSIDQPDRQHVTAAYAGIAAGVLESCETITFLAGSVSIRRAGFVNVTLRSS